MEVFFVIGGDGVGVDFSDVEVVGDEQAGKAEGEEREREVDRDGAVGELLLQGFEAEFEGGEETFTRSLAFARWTAGHFPWKKSVLRT